MAFVALWLSIGLWLAGWSYSTASPPGSKRWLGFATAFFFWPLALIARVIEFTKAQEPNAKGSESGTILPLLMVPSDLYSRYRSAFRDLPVSPAVLRNVFWVGVGSFIPLLFLQYVGEEAFAVLASQEMWATKQFLHPTLYGESFGRPPIFPWLILLVSSLFGHEYMLIAARLVTAVATVCTGLTLAWFVRRVFRNDLLAAFAAAIFLSGDVLLYRGWLAYPDPLFTCFLFGAIASLWVAVQDKSTRLAMVAVLCLSGAFLSKAFTAYIFYTVALAVLVLLHPNRSFLFRSQSVLLHVAAFLVPVGWAALSPGVVWQMWLQLVHYSSQESHAVTAGFLAAIAIYPFKVLWHLLPASAIIPIYALRGKVAPTVLRQRNLVIAALIVLINLLPYWLSPFSSMRYVMPLYPLFALIMAYIMVQLGESVIRITTKALIATVAVAYVTALIGFPLHERYVRGSYVNVAKEVQARVGDRPLFVTDLTSVGISIAANLNSLRAPKPPLVQPPKDFGAGFVLALHPDPTIGQVSWTFSVGQNAGGTRTRYLLCRGSACAPI